MAHAIETSLVETGSGRFQYLAAGPADGEVVLCFHGFPDVPRTFTALLEALAGAGYRAIAPWQYGQMLRLERINTGDQGGSSRARARCRGKCTCQRQKRHRCRLLPREWGFNAARSLAARSRERLVRIFNEISAAP